MVKQTTLQDIITCVIAVILFVFQTLNNFIKWIKQYVKNRGNTVIAVSADTTIPCNPKTNDDNALENFIRVQEELIQEHFDIPLFNAEEESKVDDSVQNAHSTSYSNTLGEKNEIVSHLVDDSYVARGIGLIAATVGRRSEFYLYSKYGHNFENIVIELNGRNCETGRATILNRNLSSTVEPKSIPVDYQYDDDRIKVTYVPSVEGVHTLSLRRYDVPICRSPYYISVEKSPTNSKSRIRLGTKKYKMVTKFGKGKCAAPMEIKDSVIPVDEFGESFAKIDVDASVEDSYRVTDVMSMVTKFESQSAKKEFPKLMASMTERSSENERVDDDFVEDDERSPVERYRDINDRNPTSTSCKTDLKLINVNLKNSNSLNTICENITDGDNSLCTTSNINNGKNFEIGQIVPRNSSPTRQKQKQNKCLSNENSYKTKMLGQTSQTCKSLPEQDNRKIVLDPAIHKSKTFSMDDNACLKNKISNINDSDRNIAFVEDNKIEELKLNPCDNTSKPITEPTQYNKSIPVSEIISNIINSICEKCSKQVVKILSEIPTDVSIDYDINLNEIRSSFETLLTQPIKTNKNIDNILENTNTENVNLYNNKHSKINNSTNLELEKRIDTNSEYNALNEIKSFRDNENISKPITKPNVKITEHQENELQAEKIILQKYLVNEKTEPANSNTINAHGIRNSENKIELHNLKLQTDSEHNIDLINSSHCDEKLNSNNFNSILGEGDLVLGTNRNDSSIISSIENVYEIPNNNKSNLIKDTPHQQINISEFQNSIANDGSLTSTNLPLTCIECTKLEREQQTIDVNEINNQTTNTNTNLNKKLIIEKSIEPILNSFKNNIVEKILQLCVNKNLSNTNFTQPLENDFNTKTAQDSREIHELNHSNNTIFLNTEDEVIKNNTTIINREINGMDKNETSEIISIEEKTDYDNLFRYIKNIIKTHKNPNNNNTETEGTTFYRAVNTKIRHLHNDHEDKMYDINCYQKKEKNTSLQATELVSSEINDTETMLEHEFLNKKLLEFKNSQTLRGIEIVSNEKSNILNKQNKCLLKDNTNIETINQDNNNLKHTEINVPISNDIQNIDLKNTNTTELKTTFENQTSSDLESNVIEHSTIKIEPLSNTQTTDNSKISTVKSKSTSEKTFLKLSVDTTTKLCPNDMETTTETTQNEIEADTVVKLNTADTGILPVMTKNSANFEKVTSNKTIKDFNTMETETMRVTTTSNEFEPVEKVEIPNPFESNNSGETTISENVESIEFHENKNNIEFKNLSEINQIDCVDSIDNEIRLKLPTSNGTEIVAIQIPNSKKMASKTNDSVSNCTAIVTIKIETESDLHLPNVTVRIEVLEPNTVIIENPSSMKIANNTNNYEEHLKQEIEKQYIAETSSTSNSENLLPKTVNQTNFKKITDLNNIKTTLETTGATIQNLNEIEMSNNIDESAGNPEPLIESKKEIANISQNTQKVSVKEPNEKNIHTEPEISKTQDSQVVPTEKTNEEVIETTSKFEESEKSNDAINVCSDKLEEVNTKILLLDEASTTILTGKIETTSKTVLPGDNSNKSNETPFELEFDSIHEDSVLNNTQSLLKTNRKLKVKSDKFLLSENSTIQLNELKEELETTSRTPIINNTTNYNTLNELKSETTLENLKPNTQEISVDKIEIKIIPNEKEMLSKKQVSNYTHSIPLEEITYIKNDSTDNLELKHISVLPIEEVELINNSTKIESLISNDTTNEMNKVIDKNKIDVKTDFVTSDQNSISTQLIKESIDVDNTYISSYDNQNTIVNESEEEEIKAINIIQKSNVTPTEIVENSIEIETNTIIENLVPNHPLAISKNKEEITQEMLVSNNNCIKTLNEPNELETILVKSIVNYVHDELDIDQQTTEIATIPNETQIPNNTPAIQEENLKEVLQSDYNTISIQPNNVKTKIMTNTSIINYVQGAPVVVPNKNKQETINESKSSNDLSINIVEISKEVETKTRSGNLESSKTSDISPDSQNEDFIDSTSVTQNLNDVSEKLIHKEMEIETISEIPETEDNIGKDNIENPSKSPIINNTITKTTSSNNTPTNEQIIVKHNTAFETPEPPNDFNELNQNLKETDIKITLINNHSVNTSAVPINELKEIQTKSKNSFLNDSSTEPLQESIESKINSNLSKCKSNDQTVLVNEQNQEEIDSIDKTCILNDSLVTSINHKNDTEINLISESPLINIMSNESVKILNVPETSGINAAQLKEKNEQNKIENDIAPETIILLSDISTVSLEKLKTVNSSINKPTINNTEEKLTNEQREVEISKSNGVQSVLMATSKNSEIKITPETLINDTKTAYIEEPNKNELEIKFNFPTLNDQEIESNSDPTLLKISVQCDTDQINKISAVTSSSVCDSIVINDTKNKKEETQKLPDTPTENKFESTMDTTNTKNMMPNDNETELSEKQLLNITETSSTNNILELIIPSPVFANFDVNETVKVESTITEDSETKSKLDDELKHFKYDHKNNCSSTIKRKTVEADELKYMKQDNTYDSLISKAAKTKPTKESDECEINESEETKIVVEESKIEIIDKELSTESRCENQNTTLETSSDILTVNVEESVEEKLKTTIEGHKSNDIKINLYTKLKDPSTEILEEYISSYDKDDINIQINSLSENFEAEISSISSSSENCGKTSQKSFYQDENDSNENSYGVQKLEMSMECTKTSDKDYLEKTFVKLEQTEKIDTNILSDDENTNLTNDNSYIVNESDLNAILCASSLEEALKLLDSKIKFKFKNKTRNSSHIMNSTMYKQSLQTSTSSNSEKNANFTEAQEFFKKIEKNYKD